MTTGGARGGWYQPLIAVPCHDCQTSIDVLAFPGGVISPSPGPWPRCPECAVTSVPSGRRAQLRARYAADRWIRSTIQVPGEGTMYVGSPPPALRAPQFAGFTTTLYGIRTTEWDGSLPQRAWLIPGGKESGQGDVLYVWFAVLVVADRIREAGLLVWWSWPEPWRPARMEIHGWNANRVRLDELKRLMDGTDIVRTFVGAKPGRRPETAERIIAAADSILATGGDPTTPRLAAAIYSGPNALKQLETALARLRDKHGLILADLIEIAKADRILRGFDG